MEKRYSSAKIAEISRAITVAPILEPTTIGQRSAIARLLPRLRDLHLRKNYSAKQICDLLRGKGMILTQKVIRDLIMQKK